MCIFFMEIFLYTNVCIFCLFCRDSKFVVERQQRRSLACSCNVNKMRNMYIYIKSLVANDTPTMNGGPRFFSEGFEGSLGIKNALKLA